MALTLTSPTNAAKLVAPGFLAAPQLRVGHLDYFGLRNESAGLTDTLGKY